MSVSNISYLSRARFPLVRNPDIFQLSNFLLGVTIAYQEEVQKFSEAIDKLNNLDLPEVNALIKRHRVLTQQVMDVNAYHNGLMRVLFTNLSAAERNGLPPEIRAMFE